MHVVACYFCYTVLCNTSYVLHVLPIFILTLLSAKIIVPKFSGPCFANMMGNNL